MPDHSSFVCADTEDNSRELLSSGQSGFGKQLTQVAAIAQNGEHWHGRGAESGRRFLDWFRLRPERFCYFHNLQYDLGSLFSQSLDELDLTLVGGRLIRAVWPQPGKNEGKVFLDSFNLWPMSVKALAPAFGLEKLDFDADSREYVFRDVEIILRAMQFAWGLAEQAGIRCPNTLGGFAVKLWRAWGGDNCSESLEISRAALFGGRVELFKPRNETRIVWHVDINSLYPSVMLKKFPGMLELSDSREVPEFGLVDASVNVPKCEIAPLPFRAKDGRILYPCGKFRGTWTGIELREAIIHGAKIDKVHEVWATNDFDYPYADFVQRLYRARQMSQSSSERLFFKLLMNNLYGRLGSRGVVTRSLWQTADNKWKGIPYGEKVLVKYQMPLGDEVNWTHAAYVTAYGRIELQKYLRGAKPEQLIYCDTDSVIFDCPDTLLCGSMGTPAIPPWYFPTGSGLGEMKIEGRYNFVHPVLPKTYQAGAVWKAKGVPKHKAREFIESGRAEYDLPFRMREAIACYDHDNAKELGVWRRVERQMRTEYDKKKMCGNRFFPLHLPT